jgi:hypothetical protein
MISEKNRDLINRVIGSFEWGSITKIYKLMEKGIGDSTIKISGMPRIPYKKVTEEEIKKEVTLLIEYIIENNIPHLEYGMWSILWINGEWEVEIGLDNSSEFDEEDQNVFLPFADSRLEVNFVPQKAISQETANYQEDSYQGVEESDETVLNRILDKSIKEENYELASKLKDIINEFYRKMKKETRKNNEKNKKT